VLKFTHLVVIVPEKEPQKIGRVEKEQLVLGQLRPKHVTQRERTGGRERHVPREQAQASRQQTTFSFVSQSSVAVLVTTPAVSHSTPHHHVPLLEVSRPTACSVQCTHHDRVLLGRSRQRLQLRLLLAHPSQVSLFFLIFLSCKNVIKPCREGVQKLLSLLQRK